MDLNALIVWAVIVSALYSLSIILAKYIQADYARLSSVTSDQLKGTDGKQVVVLKWSKLDTREYFVLLTIDALVILGVIWSYILSGMIIYSLQNMLITIIFILIIPTILFRVESLSYQKIYHITPFHLKEYRYGHQGSKMKNLIAWKDITHVDTITDGYVTNLQFTSDNNKLIFPTKIDNISSFYVEMSIRLPPLVLSHEAERLLSSYLEHNQLK